MSLVLVAAPTAFPVTESKVWQRLKLNLTGSPAEPHEKADVLTMIEAAVAGIDGRDG